jgi:dihydroorotate dehydrogenase
MKLDLAAHYESDQLVALLRAIKGPRPQRWLATALNVTERTIADWLKGGRILDDKIANIEVLARKEGIEPALYQKPRVIWDLRRSFEENLNSPVPEPPHVPPLEHAVTTILGHPVSGVVGASASVVTSNAPLIQYLSNVGLDIIVYKTVRSRFYKAHPSPNAFVCDETRVLAPDRPVAPYHVTPVDRAKPPYKALMNRFGMPSPSPEQWTIDFQAAQQHMKPGQLLILSVTGTATQSEPVEALIEDFAQVVRLARAAGATVIELNLSCPNCSGREGEVFKDIDTTVAICQAARAAAPEVKLLIKIGYIQPRHVGPFVRATMPYIDGYSAINSFPVEGQQDGQDDPVPAFGQAGLKAGLTGQPILPCGLATVKALATLREEEGHSYCILASGGVTEPSDVLSYLDAGADAVMVATALISQPLFALHARPLWQTRLSSLADRASLVEIARFSWGRALTALGPMRDPEHLYAAASIFSEWEAKYGPDIAARGPGTAPRIPDTNEFRRLITERLKRI